MTQQPCTNSSSRATEGGQHTKVGIVTQKEQIPECLGANLTWSSQNVLIFRHRKSGATPLHWHSEGDIFHLAPLARQRGNFPLELATMSTPSGPWARLVKEDLASVATAWYFPLEFAKMSSPSGTVRLTFFIGHLHSSLTLSPRSSIKRPYPLARQRWHYSPDTSGTAKRHTPAGVRFHVLALWHSKSGVLHLAPV